MKLMRFTKPGSLQISRTDPWGLLTYAAAFDLVSQMARQRVPIGSTLYGPLQLWIPHRLHVESDCIVALNGYRTPIGFPDVNIGFDGWRTFAIPIAALSIERLKWNQDFSGQTLFLFSVEHPPWQSQKSFRRYLELFESTFRWRVEQR